MKLLPRLALMEVLSPYTVNPSSAMSPPTRMPIGSSLVAWMKRASLWGPLLTSIPTPTKRTILLVSRMHSESFCGFPFVTFPIVCVFLPFSALVTAHRVDDVFEGALLARENYCTSVASLAVGLKAKGSSQGQHNGPGPMLPGTGFSAPEIKASTSEVGVDTGDLPQPPGPPASQVLPKEVANGGHEAPPDQKQQQQQTVPPPDIHDDEGGDIISHVFQSFVGVLLWIIKTIFITIPFRIVTFISLSFIAIVVISMVSLQLADDHGAISMGAGFDSMFNNPGIF